MPQRSSVVVILAGGVASRLPHKLERTIDGVTLFERVYRAFHNAYPVVVCAREPLPPALAHAIDAPVLIDREPGAGPLAALVAACDAVAADRVIAVAADMPCLDVATIARLESAWEDDYDAVVPEHAGVLEPLAALYERGALRRAGAACLRSGKRSMHALLRDLRVKSVAMPIDRFLNVNTSRDLERAIAALTETT